MKFVSTLALMLAAAVAAHGQDAPNLANGSTFAGNTQEQNKIGSVPVNIYTGMPNVSVPIYSYNNAASGLSWSVSLDYFAGGTQVGESASNVGLGWFLNGTGSITRTVRGMPDDVPTNGYLYSAAIPNDSRAYANQYYFDSLDAEQDVFQYSFNGRSGSFIIGKNHQVVLLPNSKLKITYSTTAPNSYISGFRVVTEEGVKYDFTTEESTSTGTNGGFNFGYPSTSYGSAWFLSDIISPFGTDTVKFNYRGVSTSSSISYPQVTYVRNADGVHTATYAPTATSSVGTWELSSIVFPDKRSLNTVYSNQYHFMAGGYGYAVAKIKICDSVFRYGYSLGYTTSGSNLYLASVTPYTAKETQPGYSFGYNTQASPSFSAADYWGFYNGASNGNNLIPTEGSIAGANRNANISYAIANSMNYFYTPGGGYIYYQYELNDHYPYTKSTGAVSVPGNTTTAQTNTVSFNQVFGTKQQLFFKLDPSVSRSGSAPISGTGTITCTIQNTAGTVTYATTTFSLFNLFYLGMQAWAFNVPANGSYRLVTQVASGTTVTGSFPINITWENKTFDNTHTAIPAGGLRVKRITRQDDVDDPAVVTEDFKYINTDGTSSGFLGDTVAYSYPYSETVINGSTTTTAYTVVSSEPVQTTNYTQGSPVGYSRVIVYKGSSTHNLGYTVYDFTSLADVNCNLTTYMFPYTPQDTRDWGMGLTKRVSVYDSSNNLVKRTVNTIQVDTVLYNTSTNFLSLHLGNSFTQYNGDPANAATPRVKTYIGQQYYPSSGRAYITATNDTLYNSDGSVNTSYKNYVYDTNYNVTKVITSYDRTRGLQLETRLYYPYNYTIGGTIGMLRDSGIIAPVIASEGWITGDANPRMASGSITNYEQLSAGYVKPLTSYSLQSNAPVPQTAIGLFDPSQLNRNSTYFVAQASYPAYDSKGNPLQIENLISGQSNSIIMDYNNEYPVAKISNAVYTDVAYTSFESDGSGNWSVGSTARDYSGGLTGKLAYNLSNGSVTKSGLSTAQAYIVSVWAKSGASVSINGTAQTSPIATQNGWNLYFTTVTGVSTVTVSGSGSIDELRLYPKNANMATATYEPLVGTTSTCDANSTVAYTLYDNMNRPALIKDKDLNVVKRFQYSDNDSLISVAPVYSYDTTITSPTDTTCQYDSTYSITDTNPWSDTYGLISTTTTVLVQHCGCLYNTFAQYKIVNGTCQQGVKQYSSCYYKSGLYYCQWHYIWSDCSVSATYNETDTTAQTVSTNCPGSGGGGGANP